MRIQLIGNELQTIDYHGSTNEQPARFPWLGIVSVGLACGTAILAVALVLGLSIRDRYLLALAGMLGVLFAFAGCVRREAVCLSIIGLVLNGLAAVILGGIVILLWILFGDFKVAG